MRLHPAYEAITMNSAGKIDAVTKKIYKPNSLSSDMYNVFLPITTVNLRARVIEIFRRAINQSIAYPNIYESTVCEIQGIEWKTPTSRIFTYGTLFKKFGRIIDSTAYDQLDRT